MTSTSPTPAGETCLRWPPERFFWSFIDTEGMVHTSARGTPLNRAARALPPALLGELQDVVPVPVESLHAVYVPSLRGDGMVVCAVDSAELEALHTGPALTLAPSSLPPFLDGACDPSCINVLVGRYEPAMITSLRRRPIVTVAIGLALVAVLLAAGLARRSSVWSAESGRAATQYADVLAAVNADPRDPMPLERELAQARRAADPDSVPAATPDAALVMAKVLDAWPTKVESQPRAIAVRPGSAALTVELAGDARPFLEAFHAPAGWTLDEPRVTSARGITTLNLVLRPGSSLREPSGGGS